MSKFVERHSLQLLLDDRDRLVRKASIHYTVILYKIHRPIAEAFALTHIWNVGSVTGQVTVIQAPS